MQPMRSRGLDPIRIHYRRRENLLYDTLNVEVTLLALSVTSIVGRMLCSTHLELDANTSNWKLR